MKNDNVEKMAKLERERVDMEKSTAIEFDGLHSIHKFRMIKIAINQSKVDGWANDHCKNSSS